MNHRTALLIHIVVPGQKIALTPPSVVIQFIPRLKEGKLFLHTSEFFSIDLDIECRKQGKEALFHHADFPSALVVYVDLMPQCKKFRFYKIFRFFLLIIHVICIGP